MHAVDFGIAKSPDHQYRIGRNIVRDMIEHADRAAIGPMQIIEHQHQW